MPSQPPRHRPAGWKPRTYDLERRSSHQRGYDRSWERIRDIVLHTEPCCRFCAEDGRVEPATDVDHIIAITERPDLRLEISNLRPLCHSCHSRRTATEQGFARKL